MNTERKNPVGFGSACSKRGVLGARVSPVLVALAFLLGACGGGNDLGSDAAGQPYTMGGKVQKGPFLVGSSVTVQGLTELLDPSGELFTTVTINDLGHFNTTVALVSQWVEVITSGFFFDEVNGFLAHSPIELRTISAFEEGRVININLLTQLTRSRVRYLVLTGLDFDTAQAQAQQEILAVFHIPPQTVDNFDTLDIAGEGTGNAILLAISAVLMQTAVIRAGQGSVEAEISSLMANLGQDIETDGTLDNEAFKEAIRLGGMSVDLPKVRANLETRYAELGLDLTMAPFENFVDFDGDNLVALEDDNAPDPFDLGQPVADAVPDTEYLSGEITVAGVNGSAMVFLDQGLLYKNGELVVEVAAPTEEKKVDCTVNLGNLFFLTGLTLPERFQVPLTTVVNGDRLKIGVRGPTFGNTAVGTLRIGEGGSSLSVSSFALTNYSFTVATSQTVLTSAPATSDPVLIRELPVPHLPVHLSQGTLLKDAGDGKGFVAVAPNPPPCGADNAFFPATTTTTVKGGDQLKVQIKAPPNTDDTGSAELTIGLTKKTFSVTPTGVGVTDLPAASLPFAGVVSAPGGLFFLVETGYKITGLGPYAVVDVSLTGLDHDLDLTVGAAPPGGFGVFDSTACNSWSAGVGDEACPGVAANGLGELFASLIAWSGEESSFTLSATGPPEPAATSPGGNITTGVIFTTPAAIAADTAITRTITGLTLSGWYVVSLNGGSGSPLALDIFSDATFATATCHSGFPARNTFSDPGVCMAQADGSGNINLRVINRTAVGDTYGLASDSVVLAPFSGLPYAGSVTQGSDNKTHVVITGVSPGNYTLTMTSNDVGGNNSLMGMEGFAGRTWVPDFGCDTRFQPFHSCTVTPNELGEIYVRVENFDTGLSARTFSLNAVAK